MEMRKKMKGGEGIMKNTNRCQSCYMEMKEATDFGTEADKSPSNDYCQYCYENGDFTTTQTFEEAVEGNIGFWRVEGDTSDDAARTRILAVFPTLKRWRENA